VTEIGEAMFDHADRVVPSPRGDDHFWYAVQTKTRHEKRVAAELKEKGVTVFLPLVRALHQWSDRKREVTLPLFTNYAFVRIRGERADRTPILNSNGVVGLVGMRGCPIPIPEEQILAIETILRERIPFTSIPFLDVGRRVRIRGGSLDGLEGVIVAINGDQSLVVSVEGIYKSLAIRLSGYRFEAA
jgi:transcriptional antiterminator NusG